MVRGAIEQGFSLNVVDRELYIAIVVLSRLANHDLSLDKSFLISGSMDAVWHTSAMAADCSPLWSALLGGKFTSSSQPNKPDIESSVWIRINFRSRACRVSFLMLDAKSEVR